jgi:hypothetical protein
MILKARASVDAHLRGIVVIIIDEQTMRIHTAGELRSLSPSALTIKIVPCC